jgi:hypothetical protein
VTYFAESTCGAEITTATLATNQCSSVFGDGAKLVAQPKPATTCSPSGGQLSGDVKPGAPIRIFYTEP